MAVFRADGFQPTTVVTHEVPELTELWVEGVVHEARVTRAKGGDLFANKSGDPGWYFETGAAYTIKVCEKFSLVPEAKISYGEDYYGVKGFNNVLLKLGAPITLSKNATLTPYVAGSIAIDSLHDLGVDNYFIGGAALTVTF